ncbi:iron ABC transporter permease [Gammaproteobacteria bacterium 45_16_T64]|nr:iron ABC transporter permease [Gammaproteobacteria bacterium 45_16_T64]
MASSNSDLTQPLSPTTTLSSARLRPRITRSHLFVLFLLTTTSILALPVLTIASFIFEPASDVWHHLASTVLSDYVINSLLLLIGVAVGTLTMGITSAWLTAMYQFPGRRIVEWALLLPLAMPAYIIAYTYTGLLDFAGPLQTALREGFNWQYGDYWFPEVRSLIGAICMLSFVLYPYVYLLARASFLEQSVVTMDAARSLGAGPWKRFFRVALPMARPAIVAGTSLALMETLADYGTVQYFGISTFTTGIFRTWFGLGDQGAAAQLAAMLLGFVLLLILVERYSRRQAQYHQQSTGDSSHQRQPLSKLSGVIASILCTTPIILGFLIPFGLLTQWAMGETMDASFFSLVWNSLSLAFSAALLALTLAIILGYGQRLMPTRAVKTGVRVATLGYAVPGTVIAVGIVIPLAWIDNRIDQWATDMFDHSTGLIFSGSLFILLFAYLVRFLAVALGSVESGLQTIKPSMDDSARSLGFSPFQVLRKIHLPIIRPSLFTAVLLVFVDVLKELPATLILRPFNFNTLAVRAYELASDEQLASAAPAAITIVLTGLIPVILLSRSINRPNAGSSS